MTNSIFSSLKALTFTPNVKEFLKKLTYRYNIRLNRLTFVFPNPIYIQKLFKTNFENHAYNL